MNRIPLTFDMETGDPDDAMTLCILASHPAADLRVVTVTPGTHEQIGLVRHILNRLGRTDILVGAYEPERQKRCVSEGYRKLFGDFASSDSDGDGYRLLDKVFSEGGITAVTGAPLHNMLGIEHYPDRWVGQGGFAGDRVVPEPFRLDKFKGMDFCATYNFNGCPQGAFRMLQAPMRKRLLVSKNVCHGVVYDRSMHDRIRPFVGAYAGLSLMCEAMETYLGDHRDGKKFHDPLAACCALDESCCEFREVEMLREGGKWGAKLRDGTGTFISVRVDMDRFLSVLTSQEEKSHGSVG